MTSMIPADRLRGVLVTRAVAGRVLGVSRHTVAAMVRRGQLRQLRYRGGDPAHDLAEVATLALERDGETSSARK